MVDGILAFNISDVLPEKSNDLNFPNPLFII
jgi:hypothetical protein